MPDDSDGVLFMAAGDVGPVHGPSDGFAIGDYSALVRPLLASAGLRFANCERQYSDRPAPENALQPHGCQPPEMAQIFADCQFDAVTIANNHMYDFGPDALLDTRRLLLDMGIAVTGAGKNVEEARAPAIVERDGVRVGFLGYCSVLPVGAAASSGKVGIAEIRVDTEYETRGPHAPVRVRTKPDDADLRMVIADVEHLRETADVVIVAFHWGVIWAPRIVADYQVALAHAAVDAGADIIIGHHPHIPKAIEMYRGRAIFYSVGNFCMTKPFPSDRWEEPPWHHGALRNHTDLDPTYPLMPYGRGSNLGLLVVARLRRSGVDEMGVIPLHIDNRYYRPRPILPDDESFPKALEYMRWVSEGFDVDLAVGGDRIRVGLDS